MRSITCFLVLCCSLYGQTRITVANAASGAPGLAPGSLARVFVNPTGDGPLQPLDPNTVSLRIESVDGVSHPAPVLSLSYLQAVVAVPQGLPLGAAKVVLSANGWSSEPFAAEVVASNIGIFTQRESNERQPLASPYRLTDPARPGQHVTLWGTGLGAARPVTVTLGGRLAPVSYAGPAPGFTGLDQINFEVPADPAIPDGCYVAVSVQVGDSVSNVVAIPKSTAPGPCAHPFGYDAETLARLDAGESISLPVLSITSSIGPPAQLGGVGVGYVRTESARMIVLEANAATLGFWDEPLAPIDRSASCFMFNPLLGGAFLWRVTAPFDLGEKVILEGPRNSLDLLSDSFTSYLAEIARGNPVSSPDNLSAPFFGPGAWQLIEEGTAKVDPFKIPLNLPAPIQLTNFTEASSIQRDRDKVLRWDPSGHGASFTVDATLISDGPLRGPAIGCRVPASAGQVTLPAELLQALPSGSSQYRLTLTLKPGINRPPTFEIPLKDGGKLRSVLQYYSSETLPVSIP